MKRIWLHAIAAATAAACLGCGTLFTLTHNKQWPNQIYAGTRAAAAGHSTQIDIPFSLVADTMVLPYTIPRTIYNYTHVDTLFEDCDIARLRSEIHDRTVLMIYSSADNSSRSVWPQLRRLASERRPFHVRFLTYSLDRSKKDAATLASRHGLPPFPLYWVPRWDGGLLGSALRSVGVQVEEPVALPVVAVFDSKGKLSKQWSGILDLAEVEAALTAGPS